MDESLRSNLRALGFAYSARRRQRRAAQFRGLFRLTANTTLLDLGGGSGAHVRSVLSDTPVQAQNICVADVSERALATAAAAGYRTVRLPESGRLPFPDGCFDIVFCSSVIEHVTGPKAALWEQRDRTFRLRAFVYQHAFADEIRRVASAYWVQTPARSFPVETHTWLPFVSWLPRPGQVTLCAWALKHWIHGSIPDFNLLTYADMRTLFPDATLLRERALGMTKSWIAVRQDQGGESAPRSRPRPRSSTARRR